MKAKNERRRVCRRQNGEVSAKKYFILKIDSYEGEGSSLFVNANGADSMYAVLLIDGQSAEIVDWGYESVEALLDAWRDTTFENRGEYHLKGGEDAHDREDG